MKIKTAIMPMVRSLGKKLAITESVTKYVFEHDGREYTLLVPAHFIFDGASIPRPFWGPLGLPPHGGMDGPALPHDFGYHYRGKFPLGDYLVADGEGGWKVCEEPMSREVIDLLLVNLCTHLKVCGKFKATLIYWAVRAIGWFAWDRDDKERKDLLVEHLALTTCD